MFDYAERNRGNMNERYGRDFNDDDDGGGREDWDDRSERHGRSQRDFSRSERERVQWGSGRSWNQNSADRGWGNSGQNRSQQGQGARYGAPQYERGEPYSGEYGGANYANSGRYGSDSYSGGGYGGGNRGGDYGPGNYGGSSFGGYGGGGYDGNRGDSYVGGSSGGMGRSDYGQSNQYGQSSQYGGRRDNSWGDRNPRLERGGSYRSSREGGFFGKGPKGYTRSDERIREDVCDRLSIDDEVDASDITVTVKGGEVTLEGTVPDRRSKHRAEDIADSVSGVSDVHNSLRPQKGFLQEMGDRVTGRAESEQHGHSGSGTRNSGSSSSVTAGQGTSASRS